MRPPLPLRTSIILRSKASKYIPRKSYTNSAIIWWGDNEWLNWGSLTRREYAERYVFPLKVYNKVAIYCVPEGGQDPTYQLILATKFETLKYGIEKWLI
jgi:hypothetical protein